MQYLMNFNILCSNQYGFRKNHFTALALIDLHDKIPAAFDRGKFSVGIFLDLSKALHEEPQEVIFLHGIWRHIKEFGIEGQIPRISSPVKLEKRC